MMKECNILELVMSLIKELKLRNYLTRWTEMISQWFGKMPADVKNVNVSHLLLSSSVIVKLVFTEHIEEPMMRNEQLVIL